MKYWEEALKNVSKKYKKNLINLNLEQKSHIVSTLVDSIAATRADEWDRYRINFKFDLSDKEKELIMDEHKKSTSELKANGTSSNTCINGGSSEARTQDLLLKRELLYQLS